MMAGQNKLIKSVTSLGIVQIANYIFPFITIPIVSRILGPDKIGLVNYGAAFALYFVLLVAYSFELTGVRRALSIINNQNEINNLFSTIFFSQLFLLFIAFVIFVPCIFIVPFLKQDYVVAIISFTFCIQSLFSQNWLFQAKQQLMFIAVYNFAARSLIMVFVILLIRKKEDYVLYAIIFNLVPVFVSVISFIIAYRKFNLKLKIPKFKNVFKLIKEDKVIFLSNLIISLYSSTSTVILGFYHPSDMVGYYTSAQKVVDIARNVVMRPLVQGLFPFVGTAFLQSAKNGVSTLKKIVPFFLILTLMVVVTLLIFGPYVIKIFFGEKFLESVVLLQILSVGLFAIFFNMFLGSVVMLNLRMDKFFLRISILAALISLFLNFLLVPKFGAVATSAIWTAVEFGIIIMQIIIIKKNDINIFSREAFSPRQILNSVKTLKHNNHKTIK